MLDIILDLIYPPVCGLCGKINSKSLCKKCEIKLNNQAVFEIDNYSQNLNKYFDEHLYMFMYDGLIRSLILKYKFNDKPYLYKTFIKYLLNNEKFVEILKNYDIIVAVPLSKERKKQRGYNQSNLIAVEISKKLQIKLCNNSLKKVQNTVKQSTLNKQERKQNIQGAYMLKNAKNLYKKNVLIIDDIYTTGSTVNECSKELSKAGTKKIGILTIAKD